MHACVYVLEGNQIQSCTICIPQMMCWCHFSGESKLDMKTNILYIRQLLHLYWYKYSVLILLLLVLACVVLWYGMTWLLA